MKNTTDMLKQKYLSRNGLVTNLFKQLGQVSKEGKPLFGQLLNQLKIDLNDKLSTLDNNSNSVSDADKISVEVFFFDFDQSIYGQVLIIQLLDRIRDEIKFPKIEDLKLQLESDSQKAINRIKLLTK